MIECTERVYRVYCRLMNVIVSYRQLVIQRLKAATAAAWPQNRAVG